MQDKKSLYYICLLILIGLADTIFPLNDVVWWILLLLIITDIQPSDGKVQ